MKEFLIRDEPAFRLKGRMNKCLSPENLWCVEFTGESLNDQGEIVNNSTYQFFLEDAHIQNMVKGLLS
jgi:hypothetical protein